MDEAKMASYGELVKALNLKTVQMNTHLCSLKELNDELNDELDQWSWPITGIMVTTVSNLGLKDFRVR